MVYQGEADCANGSGDTEVPPGYLCAFATTDGNWTKFHYFQGMLNKIEYPGNSYVEYGYLTDGRISALRDSGMLDSIALGLRDGNETGSKFAFSYDTLGRADKVAFPSNTGASQLQHTFEYFPRASKQHLVGAPEPVGYTKYLEFDNLMRTTKLCDNMGLCATTVWDAAKDIILSTTGPTGLRSNTIYDADDKPLENYGPAPAAWFGSDRKPLAAYVNQVPKVETRYDENMTGPAVAYYQVKGSTMFGNPKLHQFGINQNNKTELKFDSATQTFPITKAEGMDGVAASLTGKITFPNRYLYIKSHSHRRCKNLSG